MGQFMKARTLGKTGYSVSEIGLGCWQLGGDFGALPKGGANAILEAAAFNTISLWDTADVYGGGESERLIGAFNQKHPDPTRVIITKAGRDGSLYPDGYTRDNLKASINASRERLQVDSLDLVQLHCIPFEEIKRGQVFEWLNEFKQEGLIKHYGTSVETVEEAEYCIDHTEVASLQIILNVLRQEMTKTVLPKAEAKNVGIIVRLGLSSGLLSGKMTADHVFADDDLRYINRDGDAFYVGETFSGIPFKKGVELADGLKPLCPEGMTLADMSLRWLLDHSAVSTVITGASRPDQVARNARVSKLPPLSEDLHKQLADYYTYQCRQHIRGGL